MKKLILPVIFLAVLTGCSSESTIELSAVTVPVMGTTLTESTAPSTEASTETETSASEEKNDKKMSYKVEKIYKEMDLNEKVCQMFMAAPETLAHYDSILYADDWFKSCYEEYPIGGFIYFENNISYSQQLTDLLSQTQEMAENRGIGVFQAVDEEGGNITRVQKMLWTDPVRDMKYYGGLNDYDQAYNAGKTIGAYLAEYGFNVDLAPVADVEIDSYNELGNRIFSSDPIVVSDMSAAVIDGLHSQDIAATLKHFPGLGAGNGNTHYSSVYIDRSYDQLKVSEFPAFKGGLEAGCEFVMVGHQITTAAGDDLPSDLSPVVVNDWLREELGFEGIVITDSHAMGAITGMYTSSEAAVMAIKAGVDIVLMPYDLQGAIEGVKTAVNTGKLPIEQINESVIRILEAKEKMGLLN